MALFAVTAPLVQAADPAALAIGLLLNLLLKGLRSEHNGDVCSHDSHNYIHGSCFLCIEGIFRYSHPPGDCVAALDRACSPQHPCGCIKIFEYAGDNLQPRLTGLLSKSKPHNRNVIWLEGAGAYLLSALLRQLWQLQACLQY